MLGSETLEVAIGMAFLFLGVSLLCTAAKEWLEGIFKWRAMDLERALRTLLDDADGTKTKLLLEHPALYSLFQGTYDPQGLRKGPLTALVLKLRKSLQGTSPPQGPDTDRRHMRLSQRRNLPSYIPAAQFATAFMDMVARGPVSRDGTNASDQTGGTVDIEWLRTSAASLACPHLRRVMLAAIDQANNDMDRVRLNLQRWFDGTMDRASGWYKRRSQAVLFVLGFMIAALVNVDALYVMGRLTTDKAFRQAVVQEAASAKLPGVENAATPSERMNAAHEQLQRVSAPMGWVKAEPGRGLLPYLPRQSCDKPDELSCSTTEGRGSSLVHVLFGWLLTALAVMLGAPFWFDVLNKLMVIRSTVKPHEKSPEESSEDRQPKNPTTPAPGGTTPPPPPPPPPPPAAPLPQPIAWRAGFNNPDEVTSL